MQKDLICRKCGYVHIPCLKLPEEESKPIGIWGQRYKAYLKEQTSGGISLSGEYGAAFKEYLARTDSLGTSVANRVNMYNPLYYLSSYYEGYQTANVASYWWIVQAS